MHVSSSEHHMHCEKLWPKPHLQSDGSGRVPSLHIPHELSQLLSGKYLLVYFKYFQRCVSSVPLPALSHSSRHIFCHVDVASLYRLEFFRCERYHSFCTLSIPAFLRTSSLSLNSSKQTKTGLGNKHENRMLESWNNTLLRYTFYLNKVYLIKVFLKNNDFFFDTRCSIQ